MVVIYSSAADKEAAERIAKVLGDRTMLTDQFVLDSITDTTIVLVGGEVINPNTKYLVDNLYIPGVYAVRDAVGYEPCMITYVKYNNKNVFVVAGWEAEHTKWASQVIEFYGGLPDINYLTHYDQQIIFRYKYNYKQPLVVHFKLYNMPVIIDAYLKQTVDSSTIRNIANSIVNTLASKNFIVYTTELLATPDGKFNGVRVSCEVDYQTATQYYQQISKTLAIPLIVWIVAAIAAVAALIYAIGYTIDRINYWKFTWKTIQVKMDTTMKMLEYCKEQGIPLDQCTAAIKSILEEIKPPQAPPSPITQAFTMILLGLTFVIMMTPLRVIGGLFKKREKS